MAKKFFRGGAHLMHSALPRSAAHIISGVPPLMIRTSKPRTIKEITIYGNTVSGKGVGDATPNLFNKSQYTVPLAPDAASFKFISATPNEQYGSRIYYLAVTPGCTYYYSNPYGENLRVFGCPSVPQKDSVMTNNIVSDGIFTAGPDDRYLAIYPLYISKIKEGATYTELEKRVTITKAHPNGYTIPVTIRSDNDSITHTLWRDKPLYLSETATATDQIPLYRGENRITVGTDVQPAALKIRHMAL